MNAQIAAASASGIGLHYRIRVRTGSGDYRWFEGRNRPLAAPAGEPRQWVVSLQDIHDQVHAETELAASEELFRLLAENSSDVIILADLQEVTALWVSPSVERTLGWRPDEILGRSPADLIHPDDLQAAMTQFSDTWTDGDDLRQTYRVRCADGGYRWIEAVGPSRRDGRRRACCRAPARYRPAGAGRAGTRRTRGALPAACRERVGRRAAGLARGAGSPGCRRRCARCWAGRWTTWSAWRPSTFVHPDDRARVRLGRLRPRVGASDRR